jgi:hypothetical protein
MIPIPAKVLTIDKQSHQYRVLVQIELEKYVGSFHTLRFGERKPFTGACHNGRLDLWYYRDPGLKVGKPFPLWTIQWYPSEQSTVMSSPDFGTFLVSGQPGAGRKLDDPIDREVSQSGQDRAKIVANRDF